MAKANSSNRAGVRTPAKKARPDFPLFRHRRGYWAKKVKGKTHYFGRIEGDETGQAALAAWLDQRDDLLAGRKPSAGGDGLTIADLANRFLTFKTRAKEAGDITSRTLEDYHTVCGLVVRQFGKGRAVSSLLAEDFEAFRAELAKTRGPVTLGWTITKVRSLFKYGFDSGLLDLPMRYGQAFNKPSAGVRRKAKAARGPMMFDAATIRAMLDRASVPMRAMILLGLNLGYGNSDCASLPLRAIDWQGGWIDFPRPKTGVARRAKVWPETLEALRAAVESRPEPKEQANRELVFVTSRGASWGKSAADNPVAKEFRKLADAVGFKQAGVGFYSLRRTFATVASGCRDQVAVDHVMGHVPGQNDMSAVYRQGIEDERLERVAEHVRGWLFTAARKGGAQ